MGFSQGFTFCSLMVTLEANGGICLKSHMPFSFLFPPCPVSTPATATPGFTGLATWLCFPAESKGHVC